MSRSALALSFALVVPLVAGAAAARNFETVEAFAAAIGAKPGGWHTTTKLISLQVEPPAGIDPAETAALNSRLKMKAGSVHERDECTVRPPGEIAIPGLLLQSECSFARMEAGDGRWAIKGGCKHPEDGRTATLESEGTSSPETVTGRHEADLVLADAIIHLKAETVSRFIGKCRPPAPPGLRHRVASEAIERDRINEGRSS